MQELVKKFKDLIDYRDKILDAKFGENRQEAFNYPENRFWYADHINPIDKEIVAAANNVLVAKDINDKSLKTIADVFANQTLKQIYLDEAEQKDADEIVK